MRRLAGVFALIVAIALGFVAYPHLAGRLGVGKQPPESGYGPSGGQAASPSDLTGKPGAGKPSLGSSYRPSRDQAASPPGLVGKPGGSERPIELSSIPVGTHAALPPAEVRIPKRIDPHGEADPGSIRRMLRQARLVLVVCGSDAEINACKFFSNALQSDLADEPVRVIFAYRDEDMMQSFYVLPAFIPFTDVTLRLIEDGPPSATELYVGGFCFDSQAQDEKGFQLPRWVAAENGTEAGPLEMDRAAAAKALARELSSYWHRTVQ